ncbi:uncharacterized protein BJ212DRAFT_1303762 [Suillus subaureus]|uniref:Uncharacterized protein n=1 Tax=Suillus subaureus TaxID=48587 RepID=A0A9P7DXX0_9AGAM|nr:uncharacterized protein BJ212DRAFT_1303762 [Suillus subaureus]KAG1806103.1 hypothetical protein BJ212DRAFT_1303762 [Suillus subaureus]
MMRVGKYMHQAKHLVHIFSLRTTILLRGSIRHLAEDPRPLHEVLHRSLGVLSATPHVQLRELRVMARKGGIILVYIIPYWCFVSGLVGVEIPDELEIHHITRFYQSCIMVSFWKNFYPSREQVLADIESVLEAILTLCTANLDSLTQEERSSFMDEYSSLADARVQLNKGKPNSTLTRALDECEKLKLRIEFTESMQTPSSEVSIPAQSNLAVSSGTPVVRETTSSTSAGGSLHAPPTDTDCMIFGPDSSVGSPTFNIDSQEATGATVILPGDSPSLGLPAQRLPPAGARQSQTAHTVKRERVMYFAPGTVTGSPTFNIRSLRASGTIEQVVSQRSEMLTE